MKKIKSKTETAAVIGVISFIIGLVLTINCPMSSKPSAALLFFMGVLYLGGTALIYASIVAMILKHMKRKSFEKREYVVALLGLFIGALIWILSKTITGNKEAWDANLYYVITMSLAGVLLGGASPKSWYCTWAAMIFGQISFAGFGVLGMLGPFTLAILVVGSMPALLGLLAGAVTIRGVRKFKHNQRVHSITGSARLE